MAPIRCCFDQTAVWHSDAARGPSTPSLDHLIGAGDESPRDLEAEHLRGAEVEEQFDFRGLLDRQVGRLIAFEYPAGIHASRTERVRKIGSIAHQAASRCELASLVDRGHRVTNRQ